MKKILLLIAASFAVLTAFSAIPPALPITQKSADGIVSVRMYQEPQLLYTVYAKEGVQEAGTIITTANAETLELDYRCWVYYVSYTDETNESAGRYLIVNDSNGNLIEINAKEDAGPDDLETWKIIRAPLSACDVIHPEKNLPWLAELIEKAKTDKKYLGLIWLEKYYEQDVFVTNILPLIGGLPCKVFDCQGNAIKVDSYNHFKAETVIYAPPGYPLGQE